MCLQVVDPGCSMRSLGESVDGGMELTREHSEIKGVEVNYSFKEVGTDMF